MQYKHGVVHVISRKSLCFQYDKYNDENPVNIFVLKRKKRPTITRRFFYFFQDLIVIPQIVSHDSILPQPSNHYSLHSKLLSFIEYGTVRNKHTNIYVRLGHFGG